MLLKDVHVLHKLNSFRYGIIHKINGDQNVPIVAKIVLTEMFALYQHLCTGIYLKV